MATNYFTASSSLINNAACISVNSNLIHLINSVTSTTCQHFYSPTTLTRPQDLCLSPSEKSHIPVRLLHASRWLRCVCVSGSCSERANQKLLAQFITAYCVCAWRRHVPSITETIWHQRYYMLPNLGISEAAIPYSRCSRSSLGRKCPLR